MCVDASMVIAPAIAAAVVLTRVPSINMRADVAPAPPVKGATLRAMPAICVVLPIAATPMVSSRDRRKTRKTSLGKSVYCRSAVNCAKCGAVTWAVYAFQNEVASRKNHAPCRLRRVRIFGRSRLPLPPLACRHPRLGLPFGLG